MIRHEYKNQVNLQDQRSALEKQFRGMSIQRFTYDDFDETRFRLISTIQERLTEYDRRFILGITRLEPDWSQYPIQDFPSVRWKIMNIKALKEQNEKKYMDHYKALERSLLQN